MFTNSAKRQKTKDKTQNTKDICMGGTSKIPLIKKTMFTNGAKRQKTKHRKQETYAIRMGGT